MERIVLTPEQQTTLDDWRANNPQCVVNPAIVGTNLQVDDHVEIYESWTCVIAGQNSSEGEGETCVIYMPEWEYLGDTNVLDAITNRKGVNGEGMPLFDEQQMQARMSAKAGGAPVDPKQAAKEGREESRDRRRDMRDLVKAQTPETAKRLREQLKKHGLLGKGD